MITYQKNGKSLCPEGHRRGAELILELPTKLLIKMFLWLNICYLKYGLQTSMGITLLHIKNAKSHPHTHNLLN